MRRNPARTFAVFLSGSAILASLFVIASTLTFAWPPMAKWCVIVANVGLIGVNINTLRDMFHR